MMAIDVFIKLKMGLRNVYYGGGRINGSIKYNDLYKPEFILGNVAEDRDAIKKPDSYDKEK